MYAWHDLILEINPNYKFSSLSIDRDFRQKQIQLIETEKNKINDLLEEIRTHSSILHGGNKKGLVQKDDSRFGIKESNEGERYIGESKNGLEEGFGRFYNKEGQLIHEGFWKKESPLGKSFFKLNIYLLIHAFLVWMVQNAADINFRSNDS